MSHLIADIKDFSIVKQLSFNVYKVYQVIHKKTGKTYIADVFPSGFNQYIKKLADLLEKIIELNHPAIVKIVGYSNVDFHNEKRFTIILEQAKNGSLKDFNESIFDREKPPFSPTIQQKILIGISSCLKCLHEHNIAYNDFNSVSVLLDENFCPLVCDVGLGKFISDYLFSTDCNITDRRDIQYMAPEIIEGESYDNKVDVYSFAILMYETLTSSHAFPEFVKYKINIVNFMRKITEGYRPDLHKAPINKSFKELIQRCWAGSPEERPSFSEIYNSLTKDDNFMLDGVDKGEIKRYIEYLEDTGTTKLLQEIKELKEKVKKLEKEKEDSKSENAKLQDEIASLKMSQKQQEMLQILDESGILQYEKIEELGSGGGGKVFKVAKKHFYALKEMIVKKGKTSNFKQFMKEYEIISMLSHPNIIKTLGIFLSNEKIPPSMILEYFPMNLETFIENKTFSKQQIVCMIYQIVEAMKYVHFRKVIHRDLKPTNILVDSDGTIKICDFGISKLMSIEEQTLTRGIGTQKFMAPEIINEEEKYDEKVDVYSFGVVAYFMLSGGELPKIKIFDIPKGKKAEIPSSFTDFSKKLIYDCWNLDPKDRPSFAQILERLIKNHFKLADLDDTETENVENFVKQHQSKILKYDK